MADPLYVIRWEKPPPAKGHGPGKPSRAYVEVAAELRAMPGMWGVIWQGKGRERVQPNYINAGVISAFRPPGAFEARLRVVYGVRTVYARYVGGGDGAA